MLADQAETIFLLQTLAKLELHANLLPCITFFLFTIVL